MELTLIRHTTPDIAKGVCYGNSDIGVAKSFLKEANQVKKELQEEKIDFAISSPLKRCVMLAKLCGFQELIEDRRLVEMNFGDWELKPWEEITGDYADKWMENYYKYPAPGGESYQVLLQRVKEFYHEICTAYPVSHLAIFTHAGPIRALYHLIDQIPAEELFNIDVPFGSFHKFKIDIKVQDLS